MKLNLKLKIKGVKWEDVKNVVEYWKMMKIQFVENVFQKQLKVSIEQLLWLNNKLKIKGEKWRK